MTQQAKDLKKLLKAIGAEDEFTEDKVSVRTMITNHGEYGPAVAHLKPLTREQEAKIREADPYVVVHNNDLFATVFSHDPRFDIRVYRKK